MPNKASAAKRVRQNERRRIRNKAKRSDMRVHVRHARAAADQGELEGLDAKISTAQSKLAKAAKTNLVKKKTAARKISRLMKAANKARNAEATPAE